MKMINYFIILSVLISSIGCDKQSDSEARTESDITELKSNFSADEFKEAIIGKWQSVFENSEYENVIYLELNPDGGAQITLKKDDVDKEYSGIYEVSFIHEPAEGNTTLANITISSSDREIILSRVSFSLHNGIHPDEGLLLRIFDEPFGTLDRMK